MQECRLETTSRAAECGFIEVPEDATRPDGARIEIHFARYATWGEAQSQVPLLLIAGGPGQSALSTFPRFESIIDALSQHRPVLLIDQRGTGRSAALHCDVEENESTTSAQKDEVSALTEQSLATIAHRCRQQLKDRDLSHYLTPFAVDDFDRVRDALGYEKLDLFGVSYGTRAALEYMRRHPKKVNRVILDGVAPVQMALPWSFSEDFDRSWETIATYCLEQPDCAQRFPNAKSLLQDAAAAIERADGQALEYLNPRTHQSESTTLHRATFLSGLRQSFYSSVLWPLIPLALSRAIEGEWTVLIGLLHTTQLESMVDNMDLGMHFTILCNEDSELLPDPQNDEKLESTVLGRTLIEPIRSACQEWKIETPLPKPYFEAIESPSPVLMLSGTGDPATPKRWADVAGQTLSQHLSLEIPYTGHGTHIQPCVLDMMQLFLSDEKPLQIDTSCIEDIQPIAFFVDSNGPGPMATAASPKATLND